MKVKSPKIKSNAFTTNGFHTRLHWAFQGGTTKNIEFSNPYIVDIIGERGTK